MATLRMTERVNTMNDEEELRTYGYQLGPILGEGKFSKIRIGVTDKYKRKIAIKIINKRTLPKVYQNITIPRSIAVLDKLVHHPNIVQHLDIMNFDNKVFIIMELAGHGNLLNFIKLRGAIPEERAKKMFYQVITGVGHLHSMDIVHRDLTCENVLLDSRNNPKLCGFGSALKLKPGEDNGITSCAAPGVLSGVVPYTEFSYDIWGLGIILHTLVCGLTPFNQSSQSAIMEQLSEQPLFSAKDAPSKECEELIRAMLEPNIKRRITIPEIVLLEHPWLKREVQADLRYRRKQRKTRKLKVKRLQHY